MVPVVDPMLATQGIPTDGLGLYAAEPKLDGWRVTVGAMTTRTRRGRNITDQLPKLRPLANLGLRVVLDGEFVANAGRAGDLLWADDHSLMNEPYELRRERLLTHWYHATAMLPRLVTQP